VSGTVEGLLSVIGKLIVPELSETAAGVPIDTLTAVDLSIMVAVPVNVVGPTAPIMFVMSR
jgi:hypothetical protein